MTTSTQCREEWAFSERLFLIYKRSLYIGFPRKLEERLESQLWVHNTILGFLANDDSCLNYSSFSTRKVCKPSLKCTINLCFQTDITHTHQLLCLHHSSKETKKLFPFTEVGSSSKLHDLVVISTQGTQSVLQCIHNTSGSQSFGVMRSPFQMSYLGEEPHDSSCSIRSLTKYTSVKGYYEPSNAFRTPCKNPMTPEVPRLTGWKQQHYSTVDDSGQYQILLHSERDF